MAISESLYGALVKYLVDATSDDPSFDVRHFGLCWYVTYVTSGDCSELENIFNQDFSNPNMPFGSDYAERILNHTQHQNPERLAWVRKKIEEYESQPLRFFKAKIGWSNSYQDGPDWVEEEGEVSYLIFARSLDHARFIAFEKYGLNPYSYIKVEEYNIVEGVIDL